MREVWRPLLACVGLTLLLTGCKIETTVGIDADADGSGRVQVQVVLDREAARQVPDLAEQLRADDLRAAGWQVASPRKTDSDGLVIEVAKRFRSPAEASQAMEELSGPEGPFHDFRLRRQRSFLETKSAFTGTVDLAGGIEAFADETLRARLGGSPLGFDPAEVERRLGTPLRDVFLFDVDVRLPGGDPVTRRVPLGERVELRAQAERWNVRNIAAAAVSAASAVASVAVLARRRHRPSP